MSFQPYLIFCLLCCSEMWYHVFLWALFSSFLVHAVASAIAFCRLRSHKIGRFIPVAILAMGIIWPITAGAVTSMCKHCLHLFNFYFMFTLVLVFKAFGIYTIGQKSIFSFFTVLVHPLKLKMSVVLIDFCSSRKRCLAVYN